MKRSDIHRFQFRRFTISSPLVRTYTDQMYQSATSLVSTIELALTPDGRGAQKLHPSHSHQPPDFTMLLKCASRTLPRRQTLRNRPAGAPCPSDPSGYGSDLLYSPCPGPTSAVVQSLNGTARGGAAARATGTAIVAHKNVIHTGDMILKAASVKL